MGPNVQGTLLPTGSPAFADPIALPGSSSDSNIRPSLVASNVSIGTSEPRDMQRVGPVAGKPRGARRKACNECKQHKLRCDIVNSPAASCSRCRRRRIECKVEPSFQRISKRRRTAEMEHEIAGLRQRLASNAGDEVSPQRSEDVIYAPGISPEPVLDAIPRSTLGSETPNQGEAASTGVGPHPLATPLTMQSDRSHVPSEDDSWRLEDVSLSRSRVAELFQHFFKYYHPFLPLLDPQKPPLDYHRRCPLLAWTVICIASRRASSEPGLLSTLSGPFTRFMWSKINNIPQDYNIVKALCLLCTWPLPTTSQRADATFMLSGMMMQISMQLGLHRPVKPEEFTTLYVEGQSEAVKDRLQTWVVCNIVAQNVATGYGQPPGTVYDWALEPASLRKADYNPPEDIRIRLRIETHCDRITKSLYNNSPDPAEAIGSEKLLMVKLLENDLKDMERDFGRNISHINLIHLRAAELHLRCFAFLHLNIKNDHFMKLYVATTSFLSQVLDLETSPGQLITHATNYILQMIVSAAFALLRLLKSDFRRHIDFEYGKVLFNGAISALRRTSIMNHDRPVRLSDVLAQMWTAEPPENPAEDSLQLKIQCRMSMSHVFDTVWRWRHRFRQGKSTDNAQTTTNNPRELGAGASGERDGSLENSAVIYPPNFSPAFFHDAGFSEIFDSLNWAFDELPDNLVAPQFV